MLLRQFQKQLKEHFHLQPVQTKLLLAVSGGVDSVVLTDLVYQSGFDFTIAHCNFQLRGAESDRDEIFVRSLEQKYNSPVFVKKFDTEKHAAENKLSIQEAARNLRYQWFGELLNGQWSMLNNQFENANEHRNSIHHSPLTIHLVTAHNANDNIETMLMHLFRGTGIHGLTGIPAQDKARKIIRPLLFAKREEILAYAKENNLLWVEDSSNTSDKYTRNFFRLNIIPIIKEVFPYAEENLVNNLERFKEAAQLYDETIALYKKKLIEQHDNEFHIPVLKLKKTNALNTVLWEIIKDFDFNATQLTEIKKLLDADNGSYVSSPSHRIIKNRNWLIIATLETETAQHILIEQKDKKVVFEKGILTIQKNANQKSVTGNAIALLNADDIKFPLLLRKWKQGDYFYPLGMKGKKKLSRFFIDQKLSLTEKEKVWVIESDKKILWVIGYRIDDRYKLTDKTKNILRLEFKAN